MRILLMMCMLMLVACVAPQNNNDIKAAEPPPKLVVEESTAVPQVATTKPAAAKPDGAMATTVDYSCKTDSNCKIKDVGSCCGYRPACVNKDSKTFAAEVKAQCSKDGTMGICGFPSIRSCTCTNNKCEGVAGDMAEENVQ